MIPPLEMNGITYDRAKIEEARQTVIKLRASALRLSDDQMATDLANTVALLTYLRNNTERPAPPTNIDRAHVE